MSCHKKLKKRIASCSIFDYYHHKILLGPVCIPINVPICVIEFDYEIDPNNHHPHLLPSLVFSGFNLLHYQSFIVLIQFFYF